MTLPGVYHLELRQFPHSARAFNLDSEAVAALLSGWAAGVPVAWGEREWEPRKTKLTILEGPALETSELGMGRGWPAAQRSGREVTQELLSAARDQQAGGAGFRAEVLKLCEVRPMTLAALVALTGRHWPERALSERLATVERAVWELLHTAALELLPDAGEAPLGPEQWRETLITWAAWGPEGARLRRPAR